jgi:hypothetical protein
MGRLARGITKRLRVTQESTEMERQKEHHKPAVGYGSTRILFATVWVTPDRTADALM